MAPRRKFFSFLSRRHFSSLQRALFVDKQRDCPPYAVDEGVNRYVWSLCGFFLPASFPPPDSVAEKILPQNHEFHGPSSSLDEMGTRTSPRSFNFFSPVGKIRSVFDGTPGYSLSSPSKLFTAAPLADNNTSIPSPFFSLKLVEWASAGTLEMFVHHPHP